MDLPKRRASPPRSTQRADHDYVRTASEMSMSGRSSFSARGPVPIPNQSTANVAPPPLPPPTRIFEQENGHDVSWLHANSPSAFTTANLAPVSPRSSLFGGDRRVESVSQSDPMILDDLDGRPNAMPTTQSPEAYIKIEPPPPLKDGFPTSVPPPAVTETILTGERDCSRRSVKHSSDAYDQHLLSKIGKSPSPGPSAGLRLDSRRSLTALTVPPRPYITVPSPGAGSDSPGGMLDVKWSSSYQPGGVSPRTQFGWGDYVTRRSPSIESSTPSSALDHDHFPVARDAFRLRGRTASHHDDIASVSCRSNRGSYDQGFFSDMEGDPTGDLAGPPRSSVREAIPSYLDASKPGMKRRASSPVREVVHSEGHALHPRASVGDLTYRRFTGQSATKTASVFGSPHTSTHGSISSASLRTGSYSSAGSFSLGASSATSISSYDRSPGGLATNLDVEMSSDAVPKPSADALLTVQSAARGATPRRLDSKGSNATSSSKAAATRTATLAQSSGNAPTAGRTKLGGLYICDCCPKKPKKFETLEELRSHESEKQYSCQFCNNRFKNKNEAERHQNSLHLRRYSWSCASLRGFQAAFHPSTSTSTATSASSPSTSTSPSTISPSHPHHHPTSTSTGPSHDSCGFCGEEFPNLPHPDWDRRFEHLTSVHKFGECNNSKKFFRADHFRQHLKHSHAGTSGKWTNILENACMKEEVPVGAGRDSREGVVAAGEPRLESINERRRPKGMDMAMGSGGDHRSAMMGLSPTEEDLTPNG